MWCLCWFYTFLFKHFLWLSNFIFFCCFIINDGSLVLYATTEKRIVLFSHCFQITRTLSLSDCYFSNSSFSFLWHRIARLIYLEDHCRLSGGRKIIISTWQAQLKLCFMDLYSYDIVLIKRFSISRRLVISVHMNFLELKSMPFWSGTPSFCFYTSECWNPHGWPCSNSLSLSTLCLSDLTRDQDLLVPTWLRGLDVYCSLDHLIVAGADNVIYKFPSTWWSMVDI